MSFPGGRAEEGDADAVATALRETEEEVGLSRDFVVIAGALDPYETGTGFAIKPIVVFVREGFEAQARRVRGRGDLRGAAAVLDGPDQP